MLHLHFQQMKTQWSLLLHENSKVCFYVWVENCVVGVMRCVNMPESKPLKKGRLIFCNGFAYILVVYFPIFPVFSHFFSDSQEERNKGLLWQVSQCKKITIYG